MIYKLLLDVSGALTNWAKADEWSIDNASTSAHRLGSIGVSVTTETTLAIPDRGVGKVPMVYGPVPVSANIV